METGGFIYPPVSQYLLSDTELCYAGSVTLNVVLCQIVQKTTALTNHLEKTKTAVVVLLVDLEVLGELRNALCEDSDLYLR